MSVTLRDYQDTGVGQIREAMIDGYGSILYVLPTGGGKTIVFSYIAQNAARIGTRTCILVHRRELLRQASEKLRMFDVPHGVIAPGHPRTNDLVQVASKDTLVHRLPEYQFDLLVCDEAHHATAETYKRIWRYYTNAIVLGVTATPCRMSGAGLKTEFETMIVGPSVAELQAAGHLAPCKLYGPPHTLDLKRVTSRGGDYKREQIEQLMDRRDIIGDAIDHYRKHLNGAPTLVFCASVAHAEHTAALYREAGFRAESVDGSLPDEVRDERIAGIGNGRLNALMSCDLIGEGLDVPGVWGIQSLRPTKSLSVWLQQVGRGLRPAPGKTAIILDHVGNWVRHGLPAAAREWSLEEGSVKEKDAEKAPITKQCPECYHVHTPAPTCPCCGYEYQEAPARKHPKQQEGDLELVSDEVGDAMFKAAKSLKDFHRWAKATGKSPGAAWYAFKRRKASNRLEGAVIGK